jgi:hypothetical protein
VRASGIGGALAAEAATRSARSVDGVPGTEAATGPSAVPAGPGLAGAHGAGGAGRSGRRRAPSPSRFPLALRIAVAAAAVVVIAGGGYGVSRLLSGGVSGAGASSAAAPREPGPVSAQGGAAASQPVLGPAHRSEAGPSGKYRGAALYPVVSSGTNYRAGQLEGQVEATLRRFPGAVPGPQEGARHSAPATSGIASCLSAVTAGQRPLLVDMARYEGKPATVVVMPAGAHTLRVLVLSQHCPATEAGLLHSTTLPSPG